MGIRGIAGRYGGFRDGGGYPGGDIDQPRVQADVLGGGQFDSQQCSDGIRGGGSSGNRAGTGNGVARDPVEYGGGIAVVGVDVAGAFRDHVFSRSPVEGVAEKPVIEFVVLFLFRFF